MDQAGEILVHHNLPTVRQRFLDAIERHREDLVIAVECLFCWYWLADPTCAPKRRRCGEGATLLSPSART